MKELIKFSGSRRDVVETSSRPNEAPTFLDQLISVAIDGNTEEDVS